jgi:hypothetical protein
VFPEEDLEEELKRCPSIEAFAVRPIKDADGDEQIGIVIKQRAEEALRRGVLTLGQLHAVLKDEIYRALDGKPDYMKRLDFCLTELKKRRLRRPGQKHDGRPRSTQERVPARHRVQPDLRQRPAVNLRVE